MRKSILMLPVVAGGLLTSSAHAAVPLSFTHQGLLKEDGNLVNGEREITAIIVDENDAEVARTSGKVPVDSGRYIMTVTGIDSDKVATAQRLKLWVQVEGELLTPALTINSVPYAVVANRAESVKTTTSTASAVYGYTREVGQPLVDNSENLEQCPCDQDQNANDCGANFTHETFNVAGCYDLIGGSYYQYYRRDSAAHPLEVLVVENASIGIGTAQPEYPLHIRAEQGEDIPEVVVADSAPEIRLEDLAGQGVTVAGESGTLAVRGAIEADTIGPKLWGYILNRLYPVGSVYTTTELSTAQAVSDKLGGTWEAYGQGRVLVGVGNNGDGTDFSVNAFGGSQSESYIPVGTVGQHKLTVEEIPSHIHGAGGLKTAYVYLGRSATNQAEYENFKEYTGYQGKSTNRVSGTITDYITIAGETASTGNDGSHDHSWTGSAATLSHMQPYQVVYMWKRIN